MPINHFLIIYKLSLGNEYLMLEAFLFYNGKNETVKKVQLLNM